MNKHTEGPWSIEGPTYSHIMAGDKLVALLDNRTTKEDAILMTAGPELLEALEAVLLESDRDTAAYRKARAAIAKARGQ